MQEVDERVTVYVRAFTMLANLPPKKFDDINFCTLMIEFSDFLRTYIHRELEPKHLENYKCEEEIRAICRIVGKTIYPTFNKLRLAYKENNSANAELVQIYDRIEDDLYSIMALRNIKYFAYYIDREKISKDRVWERGTMGIFEPYFNYINKMILFDKCDLVRASYFPGAGKSYAGNITIAFWLGYEPTMSFLRITYNDDLTKSFVSQIRNIIIGEKFRKVFPAFDLPENELFEKNNAVSFKLKFTHTLNLVGSTTLGKGTGFRAKVLMLDDVVKGVQDAYNIEMQQKIVNMYDNEWTSRADSSNQKIIALGTMWSCYDILNVIQKRALKQGVFAHPKYKYCLCDSDNINEIRQVFISTPLLDYETDESTCPQRYSTTYARKKREDADDKDMFEAVYQQNPQEPDELLFAYTRLKVYRTIPYDSEKCESQTMAMIDPVREGQNYFAMPILRRLKNKEGEWSKWYLIDAIYRLQTNDFCKPFVIDKIRRHNVCWLGYEKNVDASWIKLVKQDCLKENVKIPKIKMIYTSRNKDNKISMARNGILNDIIYPAQGMYSTKSEVGLFMAHLTTWQFMGRNKYDDAPDSIAMFVIENPCNKKQKSTGMKVLDTRII